MLGWCIVTLASARLKASVRFLPLRGMYQIGGTCKGCDMVHAKKLVELFEKTRARGSNKRKHRH